MRIAKASTLTLMHVLGPAGVFVTFYGFWLPEVAAPGALYLGLAMVLYYVNARFLR